MEGVARYKERFFSQTLFYERAANGTLPALSWIHPPIQARGVFEYSSSLSRA